VTPAQAAEAHIAETLASAREVPWGQDGVAYASFEAYAASVRARTEVFLRSVEEYVGVDVTDAHALAGRRGDRLCLHPARGHRANLGSRRVHVLVDEGIVTAARLDRPGWLRGVLAEPDW
jgi:hypothetical protein